MYKKLLVSDVVKDGQRLLLELTRNQFPIEAAFWYKEDDSSDWRLAIVSPEVVSGGPLNAYLKIGEALKSIAPSYLDVSDIRAMSPNGPDLKLFRPRHRPPMHALPSIIFEESYEYQL